MAIHVYVCPLGHPKEVEEAASVETRQKCTQPSRLRPFLCGRKMKLTAAVSTGTPVLKEGRGGFYRPTKSESE